MWYIYIVEYYSAIKRKEIGSFVEMWMDLESVIQSEVSQKEKNISYINAYVWNLDRWYRWTYLQGKNRDTNVEDTMCQGQFPSYFTSIKFIVGKSSQVSECLRALILKSINDSPKLSEDIPTVLMLDYNYFQILLNILFLIEFPLCCWYPFTCAKEIFYGALCVYICFNSGFICL